MGDVGGGVTIPSLLALWFLAALVVALLWGAACGPADLDDDDWSGK